MERDGDVKRTRVARIKYGAKLVREWRGQNPYHRVNRGTASPGTGPALAVVIGDRARDHRGAMVRRRSSGRRRIPTCPQARCYSGGAGIDPSPISTSACRSASEWNLRAWIDANHAAQPLPALYLMLQNRIYRGEIVHKEASYKGEHEAIVDPRLWDAVQRTLAANRVERRTGVRQGVRACWPDSSTTTPGERIRRRMPTRKGTRYRYYVSRA